jgi:hypothetical protein
MFCNLDANSCFFFLLISIRMAFCQTVIKFNINDSVIQLDKSPIILKLNLNIHKSDTMESFNLWGYYDLLEPCLLPFVAICATNYGLVCSMEDSTGEIIHPQLGTLKPDKIYYRLTDNETGKFEYISVDYINKNNLRDKYSNPQRNFANNLRIKKTDTTISKSIFIKLDRITLQKGIYYIIISYNFDTVHWKQICQQEDPEFIKNYPILNEYDKCIISNKVKLIVK